MEKQSRVGRIAKERRGALGRVGQVEEGRGSLGKCKEGQGNVGE